MTHNWADPGILLVVAAALIDSRGDVLLQQRPPGKQLAGLWEFPGGKVEPGESPQAALVRELHEELDITVAPSALTATAFASAPLPDRHLILLLYRVTHWAGTPRLMEASALAWVHPTAMHALPMPPADLPLVAALCQSQHM